MELFKVLYICATIQAKKQKQSPKASPVQGEGDRLRWKGCKQKIRAHSINSEGDRLRWKGCKSTNQKEPLWIEKATNTMFRLQMSCGKT